MERRSEKTLGALLFRTGGNRLPLSSRPVRRYPGFWGCQCHRLPPGRAGRGDHRLVAFAHLGADGSQHPIWRHPAGFELHSPGSSVGRNRGYLGIDRGIVLLPQPQGNPQIYTASISLLICPYGLPGSTPLRHQHQPSPQPGTSLGLWKLA